MKYAIIAGFVVAGASAASAHAASFDCAKASMPMEKAICASPDLSKTDDALAAAFKKALNSLSPVGQADLRRDERAFLAFAAGACGRNDGVNNDCLSGLFNDRITSLGHAVTHLGGWTFVSLTTQRAGHTLTVPQIDSPVDTARDWNVWAQSKVDTAYHLTGELTKDGMPVLDSSVTVVMSIITASPDQIGVTIDSSSGEDGLAEIDNRHTAATWLVNRRHEFTGKDLFDPAKPWATALVPLAQKHLVDGDGDPDKTHKIKRLDQAGGDWVITAKGLSITYDDWRTVDGRPGAETDLSWAELKPYLRKDLPFDPTKIQVAPEN